MPVEKLRNETEDGLDKDKEQHENERNEAQESKVKEVSLAGKKKSLLSLSSAKKKSAADDPFRFQGNGMDFKAKLIGIRDVAESRGDQMCQDAMMLLKASVKASGQHKQRILFNVSLDGLKIKDEKTSNDLHVFPVAKISFIARDTSDPRAFGFVYGTPDSKHKFYAIKTAQTADHAVLSIRDMFHIVYEMKKKQMEEAKLRTSTSNGDQSVDKNGKQQTSNDEVNGSGDKAIGGPAVADLLDLQSELDNLQHAADQLGDISLDSAQVTIAGSQSTGSFSGDISGAFTSSGTYSSQSVVDNNNTNNTSDPFGDSFVPQQQPAEQQQQRVPPIQLQAPPSRSGSNAQPPTTTMLNGSDAFSPSGAALTTPDPFDTSAVTRALTNGNASHQPMAQSTPLLPPPSNTQHLTPADTLFGNVSQAPSSVHSVGVVSQSASLFDNSPEWSASGQQSNALNHGFLDTNNPLFDQSSTTGEQQSTSAAAPATTLEDAFSKLVNIESVLGEPPAAAKQQQQPQSMAAARTSPINVVGQTAAVTTGASLFGTSPAKQADPFAHMRPPKPSINDLIKTSNGPMSNQNGTSAGAPLSPINAQKLDSLYATAQQQLNTQTQIAVTTTTETNPFATSQPSIPARSQVNPFLNNNNNQPIKSNADPFGSDPFFQ